MALRPVVENSEISTLKIKRGFSVECWGLRTFEKYGSMN